jgi:hypothetical protein
MEHSEENQTKDDWPVVAAGHRVARASGRRDAGIRRAAATKLTVARQINYLARIIKHVDWRVDYLRSIAKGNPARPRKGGYDV